MAAPVRCFMVVIVYKIFQNNLRENLASGIIEHNIEIWMMEWHYE